MLAALPKSAHPGALAALKEIYNARRYRQGPIAATAYKLIEAAQTRWREVNAPHLVARTQRRDLSQRQTTETPDRHHPTQPAESGDVEVV